MKILKGFIISLLGFIMASAMIYISIASSLRNIIQDQIMPQVINEAVNQVDNNEISEAINKTKSITGIDTVIESVLNDISTGNGEVSEETLDRIIQLCKDNKETIELYANTQIDLSEIDSPKSRNELRESMNDAYKDISKEENQVIRDGLSIYNKLTSTNTRILVISLIIVCLILIGLVTWSLYAWIKHLSGALISTSVFVFIVYAIIVVFANAINENTTINITINANQLLYVALSEFASGFLLSVLHKQIQKRIQLAKEEEEKNIITDEVNIDYTNNNE